MLQRRSIVVPVAGGELSIEVTGPAPSQASQVVVFLHDLAANAVTWRLVTARLAPSTGTYAIDARGRAASAALPGPFGMATHVADVLALLDHLAIASCVVVGHGTGALIATNLAAAWPDRVAAAVLVDGGLPITVTGDPHGAIEEMLLPVLQRLRATHVDRDAALLDAQRRSPTTDVAQAVYDDSVLHDLGGLPPVVRSRTNEEAVWFDGSELLLDPSISAAIERVSVPVELLQGDPRLRHLPTGVGNGEPQHRLSHLAVVTLPGLDHEAMVLHPQGADAISRSIARVITRSTKPL